jgi:hypothetical protein
MFFGYSETFYFSHKHFNEILPQKLMWSPAAPFLREYEIVGLSLTKQNVLKTKCIYSQHSSRFDQKWQILQILLHYTIFVF